MDALENGFQALLFLGDGKFLCVPVYELSIELLSQNISKRFRRRNRMCLITYRNNFSSIARVYSCSTIETR